MEKDKGSIETNEAVCGPAISPNREVDQNSNEGQPRVGELFFIHQEVDNVSISSISSDPTAYTETEIVGNLRDSFNYAPSITASSVNSSVSSITHCGIVKFKSRSILTAFRKKAFVDRSENSISEDEDALPGHVPKTWFEYPAVNKSADPTIDLENQPSQEESSGIPADEESVISKGHSSISSYSDGFGGFIYHNYSELNPRTTKLFIMTASMLLVFGVSAVVAAIIVDGNPAKSDAGYSQLTSLYDSPTVGIPSTYGEAPETAVDPTSIGMSPTIAIDNAAFLQVATTTSPSTTPTASSENASNSNDESFEWIITKTSTSEATTFTVDHSTTDATTSSTATSSSTSSTVATTSTTTMPPSTTSSSTAATTSANSTVAAMSTTTMPPSTTSSSTAATISANSTVAATSTTTTTASPSTTSSSTAATTSSTSSTVAATSTTTTTVPPSTTSSSSKLSATYIQAVANSFLTDGKAAKADKKKDKKKEKDKKEKTETIIRFDISPMLNDPRNPFKVFIRTGSNSEGFEKISLDYLPKAGLWDCSPCKREKISLDNSVAVGSFDNDGFVDIASAFLRGIFNNQMTFKLNSSKMVPAAELVILWVEGNVDNVADLSTASLMELVSEDDDVFP